MKKPIDYRETTSDLLTRIDIHQRFGSRDIDAWMLELLDPPAGARILDVGCGAGKQCFMFYKHLAGQAEIVGGDVSAELLAKAREESERLAYAITFQDLDFNARFPFEDGRFDLVSCCFAIYYAADPALTVREMHRILRGEGRLFTTGPLPDNKRLFYDIIREATGRPIPPMPGSSRYGSEILSTIRAVFAEVEVHVFENPLTFREVEPFLDYTRASLSEDRKLWGSFFQGSDDFERVMAQIAEVSRRRLERDGSLVMTKVVGGLVARK
jgi:ubiquinone/menaquinone biosynthesis C-methylase UbiE